jgi:hypothetical protein
MLPEFVFCLATSVVLFSLLSFASPKERSKEKEPEIDVRPISDRLDVALVLL